MPSVAAGHIRAEHQRGILRRGDGGGELGQTGGVGGDSAGHRAHGEWDSALLPPVVEGDGEEDRTGRWLEGDRVGAHEGGRNVVGADGLVGPLHVWRHDGLWVLIGEPRLQQQHLASLLTGGDDQRRAVLEGTEGGPQRVCRTRRGVDVHQHRFAGGLRVAIGGSDDRSLVDAEDVAKVVGEVLQTAQDEMQRISGNPVYYTSSSDATGKGRRQILDRRWKVCSQSVAPGTQVPVHGPTIDFSVVKLDETCP